MFCYFTQSFTIDGMSVSKKCITDVTTSSTWFVEKSCVLCNYYYIDIIKDSIKSTMDEGEFKSHAFQRVFQYLHRHAKCESLDEFSYMESMEGEPGECLQTLLT